MNTLDIFFLCQRIRHVPLAPEAKGINARGKGHGLSWASYPLTDPKERGCCSQKYLFQAEKASDDD